MAILSQLTNNNFNFDKNPKFVNQEQLRNYIKNMPTRMMSGGRIPIAPYKNGGIIGTIIPSTMLSSFNQNGNIIRPNSLQINRSRQAIINKNLI